MHPNDPIKNRPHKGLVARMSTVSRLSKSLDYSDVHVPRLGGKIMSDEKEIFREDDEDTEMEENE